MRLAVTFCSMSIGLALADCSSTAPGPASHLPLSIGGGVGSQYGNYVGQPAGEMRGPSGARCVAFNWDRPLAQSLAVRYRSASCEAKDHPGRMIVRDISRTVIPIEKSNLNLKEDAVGGPDAR